MIDIKTITAAELIPKSTEGVLITAVDDSEAPPIPWDADVTITDEDMVRISGHCAPGGMGSCVVELPRDEAAMLYVFSEEGEDPGW
jgi:hypothetical protein